MKINFEKTIGKIKPMHAVGQPPYIGTHFDLCWYLKEAHIPYCRLHDMGQNILHPMVDIPRIFPCFEADEQDPASYDFEYTDLLLEKLYEYDCPPVFRLGVTIENAHGRGFKPRYINPPKDPAKWARICEKIIAHYNEGWAEGYHFGIKYWEIWNEPDFGFQTEKPYNQMWTGTNEQFYELYAVTAKHLKACFGNRIKVGGYGSCGFYHILSKPETPAELYRETNPQKNHHMEFLYGFLDYIQKEKAPLEFFSWHSYAKTEATRYKGNFICNLLKERGYENTEVHLNEWNNAHDLHLRNTAEASAKAVSMMIAMHETPVDMLMYYDARLGASEYGGMFNPDTWTPCVLYYSFKAFGELYTMGNQVECTVEEEDVYAIAATNGTRQGVLITNLGKKVKLNTGLSGFSVYLVDENNHLEKVNLNAEELVIKTNQVVYLEK